MGEVVKTIGTIEMNIIKFVMEEVVDTVNISLSIWGIVLSGALWAIVTLFLLYIIYIIIIFKYVKVSI